ncbi:MAG TPA: tetratricopeptide repeat protein [Vicinamibacteria bacterium]
MTRTAIALVAALALAPASSWAQGQPDAEAKFNMGLSHLRENRPALALEQFRQAIKQDPKNPYFHKGLGLALLQLQKYDEAVVALRKSLELNPYYVDVRNDLGTALLLGGHRAEGKAELLRAYNEPTNPTPDMTARNLGQAYLTEKDYDQAANWFRSSLGRNKGLADSYLGLADCQLAINRNDEAIATLEGGLKELPDNLGLILALGNAYFRAGRFTEARAKLEEVARRDARGPAGKSAGELLKNLPK